MQKFLENLYEAERILKRVDHIVYVTYPVIKDKRLLIQSFIESKNALAKCINSILRYEHIYKRIRISNDPNENLKIFKIKCAPRYNIQVQEIKLILELFDIAKKHKKSTMEFKRKQKIIILSENSKTKILTIEDSKRFLHLSKQILKKTKQNIIYDY